MNRGMKIEVVYRCKKGVLGLKVTADYPTTTMMMMRSWSRPVLTSRVAFVRGYASTAEPVATAATEVRNTQKAADSRKTYLIDI